MLKVFLKSKQNFDQVGFEYVMLIGSGHNRITPTQFDFKLK